MYLDNIMENTEKNYTLMEILEAMYPEADYGAEERQDLINETSTMITEAAMVRGLEQAGEDAQNAFAILMDHEPTEQSMDIFIKTYIPNFSELVIEELQIFQKMGEEENVEA